MRPVRFTLTGVSSQLVPLNWRANPTSVQINCVINGTVTFEVDGTLDDPYQAGGPTNFLPTALIASGSANVAGTVTAPVTAVVCKITAGTGSVLFEIVQAGGSGAT
jgi:hypothetical protein